jgi:F-type H+-transporting ATPase subunit delta
MKTSKQARRDSKQLFNSCKVNGVLDEKRVKLAVSELIAKKPRGYMGILSHFQRLVRLDVERRAAVAESAAPLPDALAQSVRAGLVKRYGDGVSVTFAVNKDLIGGLRIKVGSDVFDGSVRARLNELEEKL